MTAITVPTQRVTYRPRGRMLTNDDRVVRVYGCSVCGNLTEEGDLEWHTQFHEETSDILHSLIEGLGHVADAITTLVARQHGEAP